MLFALLVGSSAAQAQAFADLARSHALTASDEHRIGAGYVALAGWTHGTVDDPAMVRRVERIARRALDASDRPDAVVNVLVADDPTVNAAAYPGGFLVVNRGAAERFDDDELTFVLGHELAHVQLRHYATTENLKSAMGQLSLAETAMSTDDRAAAVAAAMEIDRLLARHGKQLELEADLYGLLYAARAGAPMEAAFTALRKLEAEIGPAPEGSEAWSHHPDFAVRLAELERGRSTLEEVRRTFDLGLTALSVGLDELAVDSFQEFLTLYPRSSAGWTNLAAAHLRQGLAQSDDGWLDKVPVRGDGDVTLRAGGELAMDRARDACARALAVDPHRAECLTILGVLARHSGDLPSARALLARAYTLHVGRHGLGDAGIAVNRGIVEAVAGDPAAAEAFWTEAEELEAGEPFARANRAVFAEKRGDPAQAVALWTALLKEGRLVDPARDALQRLAPGSAPAAAPPQGPVTLGRLTPGMSEAAVLAALGEPGVVDADDVGLRVFQVWPDTGVSALFYADAAVGFECWGPCALDVRGLKLGAPWGLVHEKLGVPTEELGTPLGVGRTARYGAWGLTVTVEDRRVTRFTLAR